MSESKRKIILDSNNNNLLNGDAVKLVKISGALIDGLPESDITAIENQILSVPILFQHPAKNAIFLFVF